MESARVIYKKLYLHQKLMATYLFGMLHHHTDAKNVIDYWTGYCSASATLKNNGCFYNYGDCLVCRSIYSQTILDSPTVRSHPLDYKSNNTFWNSGYTDHISGVCNPPPIK
jgi:hypothetical protein